MKGDSLSILLLFAALLFGSSDAFGQAVETNDARNPNVATVRLVPSQYSTIQAGIDAANDGDTVLVSDGTYYENIRFMGKKIVVASTYLTTSDTSHISRTVIDGSRALLVDSASVVYFISGEDTNSVLCGFTITGGTGTYLPAWDTREGGGVLCISSGARLIRNIITGNTCSGGTPGSTIWGGGISADLGTMLIIEGNTVSGNTLNGAWAGAAGIYLWNTTAIVQNNSVTDNTVSTQGSGSASHGGGILCEVGTFVLKNNFIARNRALSLTATQYRSYGGGVLVRDGILEFRNNRVVDNLIQTSKSASVFTSGGGICLLAIGASELRETILSGNYIGGNSALGGANSIGGGIAIRNQRARIENNIIEKNTALNGGGIGIEGSLSAAPAVLVNNTIYDNNATQGGGAHFHAGAVVVSFNNIFWADTAQSQAEISVSGSTAEVHYSDVQGGYSGTDNIDIDPLFVPGDSLFDLTASSPCIGRGVDSIQIGGVWYQAPASDFDGHPRHRPAGLQASDIGAQEEQVTTGVDNERADVPTRFVLQQNYPNPFNPSTTITYELPKSSEVRLSVYDMLGREVTVLVSEKRDAGIHEVKFDGSHLASGVYFYRLTAGDFVQSKGLTILK